MSDQFQTIPDPYQMDWQEWVDTLVGYNPDLYVQLDPDLEWQEFGEYLCDVDIRAPQPAQFDNWQDWAAALKLALGV